MLDQTNGLIDIEELVRQEYAAEILAKLTDKPEQFAEEMLAVKFCDAYARELKYVHLWGKWMHWNGKHWSAENTLLAYDFARQLIRDAFVDITGREMSPRLAMKVAAAQTVNAVVTLARSDRRLAAKTDDWDRDPWLLNTPGGTVDLRTGLLRPHDPEDRITKITAVAPGGGCPLWLSFLDRVFNGDRELIDFVQRALGYAITGSIREHALFFFYGTGGNGKGVLLNTFRKVTGDYACVASTDTFTASHHERHPADLAMLRGARAVIAQETEEGQRWAEARIKALTGGDAITARFMRQDFFTFEPQFKLIIAGNHKPQLRNVDEAIRRRLYLVPFTVTIPEHERDPALTEKLAAEHSGILAWLVEGALKWQRDGLRPPAVVRAATEQYLSDEDALGRFLAERCSREVKYATAGLRDLFSSWREWCAQSGEYCGSERRFSQLLAARGFRRELDPKTRRAVFIGLDLLVHASGSASSAEG